ncbi:unnamed protein product (macronuclear) [Paramecium tetraurelia]|uniref:Uncharacterized protein n=1 Tax=Paramecium tetraurelia TaxID=5888 RepID=A0DHY5_PARTE|nr:uncharacterized protein GSPATT00017023001 [Paramecium tetraurelia]CAK82652.1 unnamed protein product [Paramecium tetraurelia]|eukprot:XP_001450049.1 hypothetical protein (macronuclear) [Paramecium tetraurelia strain d4-2]
MYSSIRESPQRHDTRSFVQEIEFLKAKCQELETENRLLFEEQQQLQRRAHDIVTNDSNVESYIKENNMLQTENEKLIKLSRQRKTDADLWKSKYENQLQQILQMKSNYEFEIKQLNAELQKLGAVLSQAEAERQRQLVGISGQIESQSNQDFENLKKATNLQIEISESQIRKLRDHIDEQNNEISDLQQKILRQKTEDDIQIERLLKENELLRVKIHQQESEKQRELEHMNDNLNNFSQQQIQLLKHEFARQSDVQQSEIDKLKGLLEIKNAEIETLLGQNAKNKQMFEDQINDLRTEIQILKQKLLDQERQARVILESSLKDQQHQHQRDQETLKSYYQTQIINLEKEINDLKGIIEHKNQQIQIQIEEKNLQRQQLEQLIVDLRREIENQKLITFEQEKQKNNEINELDDQFQKSTSLLNENIDQQKLQILFLEGEIEKLKEMLSQKTKDQESLIAQFNLHKRQLEDDIRRLKDEIHSLKQEILSITSSKNQEIQDLQSKNDRVTIQYREKLRQSDISQEQQLLEIKRLRETLSVKEQENENLANQRNLLDKDLKRARDEIEQFKQRQLALEREKFTQLEDLKNKLEASNSYQISNLKAAYNTQISVLTEENVHLKQQIDQRRMYDSSVRM